MSGAEAALVIGLIASVVTTVEVVEKLYDAAQDARGQPEAFRQVAARLPLIIDILRTAEEVASTADETTLETSKKLLESASG